MNTPDDHRIRTSTHIAECFEVEPMAKVDATLGNNGESEGLPQQIVIIIKKTVYHLQHPCLQDQVHTVDVTLIFHAMEYVRT